MDLVKKIALFACASVVLASPEFKLEIGPAVASGDYAFKSAAFVVRVDGCNAPDKPQITGSAEGMVKGVRKSAAVRVVPTTKPNVYAISQTWPEGDWVVNLKGVCGKANAGAIVPIGAKGFIRDAVKMFARPATEAEIEASLKALTQGGNQ